MPEPIKATQDLYAFNVTWHGGADDPMFTVRANTIEEFRERCTLILEGWAAAQPVVTVEVGDSAPAQQTPAPPPTPTPQGPACGYEGCGKTMEWRTGSKDGVPWKGWFCPTRNRAHKAIWV